MKISDERNQNCNQKGEFVSMAVVSNGEYDTPKGLIYSFPVVCNKGQWSIVKGLQISNFSKEKMKITAKGENIGTSKMSLFSDTFFFFSTELLEEREEAFAYLKIQ